jgi:hypothetical protein
VLGHQPHPHHQQHSTTVSALHTEQPKVTSNSTSSPAPACSLLLTCLLRCAARTRGQWWDLAKASAQSVSTSPPDTAHTTSNMREPDELANTLPYSPVLACSLLLTCPLQCAARTRDQWWSLAQESANGFNKSTGTAHTISNMR